MWLAFRVALAKHVNSLFLHFLILGQLRHMENGEKLLVTGSDGLHPYLQHAAQAEAMGRRGDLLLATLLYSWCLAGLPDRSFSLPCKKGTENQAVLRPVKNPNCQRRATCVFGSSLFANLMGLPAASASDPLILPLEFERGAFLLTFQVQGSTFRGVADTGSPFLLVAACVGARRAAGRCSDYCSRYGCSQRDVGRSAGLADNIISFAGGYATAVWRQGDVQLGGCVLSHRTLGVLGETQSFGGNAGGPNFGLIKLAAEDSEIRPTFLSQTPYTTLVFDFRNMSNPVLELAEKLSPWEGERAETMLTDLRDFGAGVQYYAVVVEELLVDHVNILEAKTVAILDTGTTGLVLPKSLFFSFDAVRRASAQEVGIKRAGNVEVRFPPLPGSSGPSVSLQLRRGRIPDLDAALDIVTPLAEDAGSVFLRAELREMQEENLRIERPSVIFVGLGFFAGLRGLVASLGCIIAY
ncbi:unnamed protein product [Durusdinium trenchii]|uniref:Peptidase A1 domain-containing protein n=1 Tax=Durusdinium trenchii TaxID=1381693 RepID=A0ABP0STW4_9DINO